MNQEERKDVYRELYEEVKFTTEELKEFPECQALSLEELEQLSDLLFDLGLIAQKIMIECH